MKKLALLAIALSLISALAFGDASSPFQINGNSRPITAAVSPPTPVQVTSTAPGIQQYAAVNVGAVTAYVSYGPSAAIATANCKIPDGTAQSIPLLPLAGIVVSGPPNSYFCAVTASSTATVFITPGIGQ